MKLGILGGSFNPIHNGHLAMANAVRGAHHLDRVLLVPAARPPHKHRDLASPEHRFRMVELAVAGHEGLVASDVELHRPGPSFTVDTLEELQRRYPGATLFFIVGEDSIPEFRTWKSPQRILELARVVAVNRPGFDATLRPDEFPNLPADLVARLERDRVTMDPCPVESRKLRERLRSGGSIDGQVPEAVARYIESHGLYR